MADLKDVELGDRNPNESFSDSVSNAPTEPGRTDFIGTRYAEDDPAVSSMGHGDSTTDLGIEERRGGYGDDVGMRLACPPVGCSSDGKPVYSNPRYSSPQRSNLRRLPSLDRLPARASSNSTVNAPSVNASTAELVDGKTPKPKDENSPKSKFIEFFNNPKYEKPRALALIILLIVILILIIVLPIVLSRRDKDKKEPVKPVVKGPMAQVEVCGPIEGVYENDVAVYKGIPYALSPAGRNRWKPPREINDAAKCKVKFPSIPKVTRLDKFGGRCYQRIPNGYVSGNEDCLYLNVWTPSNKSDTNLPVIVYIHGGQLSFGGGDAIGDYDVHGFVKKHKLVVVSMNYRLGPFGFMTLKEFPDFRKNGMSGNYGLMDQIAALKWVKLNIKNFGGNPAKVTLLGWESGGTSVLALMNSEKARNLFHGAWIMDGGFIRNQPLKQTQTDNDASFLPKTGCAKTDPSAVMDCLYALEPTKVVNSAPWLAGKSQWALPQMYNVPSKDDFMAAIITIDGDIVKKSTSQMVQVKGIENNVPVVFGNGEAAADLDPPYFSKGEMPYLTTKQEAAVKTRLGTFSNTLETLLDQYKNRVGGDEKAYTMMVTDMRARCPTNKVAGMLANTGSKPVYRYIFTTKPTNKVDALARGFWSKYAFRGVDMIAAFGGLTQYYAYFFKGVENFDGMVQKNLAEFATKGSISAWRTLPNEYVVLNSTSEESHVVVSDTLCAPFEKIGNPIDLNYAWMN